MNRQNQRLATTNGLSRQSNPVDLDDIRQQFLEPAHFPNFFSTAPNTHIPMFTGTTLTVIQNGVYPYTDNLRTMESYRLNQTAIHTVTLPTVCDSMGAISPEFKDYLTHGIRYGFRIGFNTSQPLQTTRTNMPSARLHPNVVQEYLDHECHEGRVIGPLAITDHPEVHVRVIPKKHQRASFLIYLTRTTAASTTNRSAP